MCYSSFSDFGEVRAGDVTLLAVFLDEPPLRVPLGVLRCDDGDNSAICECDLVGTAGSKTPLCIVVLQFRNNNLKIWSFVLLSTLCILVS